MSAWFLDSKLSTCFQREFIKPSVHLVICVYLKYTLRFLSLHAPFLNKLLKFLISYFSKLPKNMVLMHIIPICFTYTHSYNIAGRGDVDQNLAVGFNFAKVKSVKCILVFRITSNNHVPSNF